MPCLKYILSKKKHTTFTLNKPKKLFKLFLYCIDIFYIFNYLLRLFIYLFFVVIVFLLDFILSDLNDDADEFANIAVIITNHAHTYIVMIKNMIIKLRSIK